MGQDSPIVESAQGFHLLKLAARQPGHDRKFEEVKGQLLARIGRESRTKEFDEYVKKLREKASIKIDDAELEKIAVSSVSPPTPAAAISTNLPVGTPRDNTALPVKK